MPLNTYMELYRLLTSLPAASSCRRIERSGLGRDLAWQKRPVACRSSRVGSSGPIGRDLRVAVDGRRGLSLRRRTRYWYVSARTSAGVPRATAAFLGFLPLRTRKRSTTAELSLSEMPWRRRTRCDVHMARNANTHASKIVSLASIVVSLFSQFPNLMLQLGDVA